MELTYPINLTGIEEGAKSGDVLTRYGEYLGKWILSEDEPSGTGEFQFILDGEGEPLFSERIGVLDSGMFRGLAMSELCSSIGDWHADKDQVKTPQ